MGNWGYNSIYNCLGLHIVLLAGLHPWKSTAGTQYIKVWNIIKWVIFRFNMWIFCVSFGKTDKSQTPKVFQLACGRKL